MPRTSAVLVAVLASLGTAYGAEPFSEFLAGLRDRGYYDYALIYLDAVGADPKASAEQKVLVPFEKASTLIEWARSGSAGNPELATRNYDQALALLDEFIKNNPRHEKAGSANSDRGRILLGKARIETWNAQAPGNEGNRGESQRRAFELIRKAREIFQTARDQHEKTWKSFPPHLDKLEQPDLYEQRRRAEVGFIQAQLDVCDCVYEEAHCYDKDSDQYRRRLNDAADEYEKVHARYRTQLGGLHARAKQAKCFEEQDDVQRALGIYNELLSHPDEGVTMLRLKDLVRQFRLICLNHPSRKDYQVVVEEAAEWLSKASASRRSSAVGLGILWEQARAQEKIAEQDGIAKTERDNWTRQALRTVQLVKRYPGQYREIAASKERELLRRLQGEAAADTPQDFVSASSLAEELVTKKTKELLDAVTAARRAGANDEIKRANDALETHIEHAKSVARAALRLADRSVPSADLNRIRYYLAYMHYLAKESYETAVITEFLATHSGKDNVVQAQEAAYMALGAYVQAFNENEKAGRREDQEIDVAQMEKMARLLVEKWPSSDRAMDARLQMGSVCGTLNRYDEAADWLGQIPESSGRYADAQKRIGQVLWSAYIEAAQLPDVERPPQAKLDDWSSRAETHFRRGIEKSQKDVPSGAEAPESLVAAKVALVQILVQKGEFSEALTILTQEPSPVVFAVAVADESKRPKSGIQSVEFASLAYQLLLRCYVGTQQLNEARAAMANLERVGGGSGEHVTEVYKELGLELQKELERLKGLGQAQRLEMVRRSFETFLDDMSHRKDQTSGSLIWIGETYFGLGESSSDDSQRSVAYFQSAADAYDQILERAKDDPQFIDEDRLLAVRLRLAACRRKQKQFDQALALLRPILTKNAAFLDAQFEANSLFQDWGSSNQRDAAKQFQKAIHGDPKLGSWGWGLTAKNIHRLLNSSGGTSFELYEEKLYEAILKQAQCRYEYGMALSGSKRKEQLSYAKTELLSFVAISQDIPQSWWRKFDTQYREVLGKLGEPVKSLEKSKPVTTVADRRPSKPSAVAESKPNASKPIDQKSPTEVAEIPAEASPQGSGALDFAIFAVIILAGIGGTAWMVLKGGRKRRVAAVPAEATIPTFDSAEPTASPRTPRSEAPRPRRRSEKS